MGPNQNINLMKPKLSSVLLTLLFLGCSALADAQSPRDLAWREDLEYLRKFAEESHFNLYHTLARDQWTSEVRRIHKEIPDLSDLQVIGELMKLIVQIQDGHSVLYPPFEGPYAFHALPLEFYFFGEDLYIRSAEPRYGQLAGRKVVAVNDLPIQEVLKRVNPYINRDNDYTVKWILPIALQFAELYVVSKVANQADSIRFKVADGTELSVESGALMRNPMGRFAPEHWVDMRKEGSSLWSRDPENYYWYEYLRDQGALYFQFNQIRDKEEQSIADFVKEVMDFIHANAVEVLIIDLRHNNGGNSFLNKSLVHALICNDRINQQGKLFAITGRRTFSAAMNLASDLEKHTYALFVGEPTGSSPNFYGEDNTFRLPNSGLQGSISSHYWLGGETSSDGREWIEPDIRAEMSAEQYRNNADPCLAAIFEYLENPDK